MEGVPAASMERPQQCPLTLQQGQDRDVPTPWRRRLTQEGAALLLPRARAFTPFPLASESEMPVHQQHIEEVLLGGRGVAGELFLAMLVSPKRSEHLVGEKGITQVLKHRVTGLREGGRDGTDGEEGRTLQEVRAPCWPRGTGWESVPDGALSV